MIWLFLGGARSGKSAAAEGVAAALPAPVTYVATMRSAPPAGEVVDPELSARIEAHRRRRPAGWATVEAGRELGGLLRSIAGTVLVDSLGPWVAAHEGTAVDAAALCAALRERTGDTVVVSEEVGMGVHPETAEGRWFRDEIGALNQRVAATADQVYLVVAGQLLALRPTNAGLGLSPGTGPA